MRNTLRVRYLLLTMALGLFAVIQASAQMKIGDNPTQIHKSSILELESNKQGLLLTRISDFADINALIGSNNVDGMIVYFTGTSGDGAGLYMRKNGAWEKVASTDDAAGNWSLKGNTGTDDATDFVGTTDAQDLVLKANNTEGLRILQDGNVQITNDAEVKGNATVDGNASITGNTDITGSLKVGTAATGAATDLNVLLIQADGTIIQRTLSQDVFTSAITSITTDVSNAKTSLNVTTDADGKATIEAPIMDATAFAASTPYGFMTKEDWDKLNNMQNIVSLAIGALDNSETTKGATITDDGDGNFEIHLTEADATHNGIVTTGTQIFAGAKTFNDNLTVGDGSTAAGLTVAKGDATLTEGNLNLTKGNATLTEGNLELTKGDATLTEGNLELTKGNATLTEGDLTLAKGNLSVTGTTDLKGATTVGEDAAGKYASLVINGATAARVLNVNTNLSLSGDNAQARTYLIDASGGAITITLPSSPDKGTLYTFKITKNANLNDVTVSGGTYGDGNTSMNFYNAGSARTIQYDGSAWQLIGQQ